MLAVREVEEAGTAVVRLLRRSGSTSMVVGAGVVDLRTSRSVAVFRPLDQSAQQDATTVWGTQDVRDWAMFHVVIWWFDRGRRRTLAHGRAGFSEFSPKRVQPTQRVDPAWALEALRRAVASGFEVAVSGRDAYVVSIEHRRLGLPFLAKQVPLSVTLSAQATLKGIESDRDGILVDDTGVPSLPETPDALAPAPLLEAAGTGDWEAVQRVLVRFLQSAPTVS